ncbi:MAG: oligosaccharide flippase family protein [Promethearchaeota archaeon]
MTSEEKNQIKKKSVKDQRTLAKNSFYSYLGSYSNYILALVTSFLLARMISISSWGYLVTATAIISIFTFILGYLPPGLTDSLNYYIPRYKTLKQMNILRSFILYSVYTKLLIELVVFFVIITIFICFSGFFMISLNGFVHVLFILAPLMLITNLFNFLRSIHIGFGRFKFNYIISIIKFIINAGLLFLLFLFDENVTIEKIAVINILTVFYPLLISFLVFYFGFLKIKKTDESPLKYKEFFSTAVKYGGFVSIDTLSSNIWGEAKKVVTNVFVSEEMTLGYSIAKRYTEVVTLSISSFTTPLLVSFSSLSSKNETTKISKIYKLYFKYSFFLISIVSGILFVLADFFLFFVYGEDFLVFSFLLKLFIFTLIFNPIGNLFLVGLKSINKVKLIPVIDMILFSIRITAFLIGIIFFGIYGALIGLIISRFIIFLLLYYFSWKILNIKLDLVKIFFQFLIFFSSLFGALIIGDLLLNELYFNILEFFNLSYFSYINLFTLGIFLVLFLFLNFFFKIITRNDIENIESILTKEKLRYKIVRKVLQKLKTIAR